MKMIDRLLWAVSQEEEGIYALDRAGVRRRLRINIHVTMLRNHLDGDERKFAESIT